MQKTIKELQSFQNLVRAKEEELKALNYKKAKDRGRILKHIRIFNKQTQLELAKNLNISRSYISEIESNNKTPTIEILQKYSDVFNIPLSTIMLFAEEYEDKKGLRKKAKSLLAKTAIDFLDWICKEDEKK